VTRSLAWLPRSTPPSTPLSTLPSILLSTLSSILSSILLPILPSILPSILPAGTAGADEAHFWVPTAVAARVEVRERSGLLIGLEAVDGGALVSVSHEAQALAGSPPYPLPAGTSVAREDLEVPPGFALPPEVARLARSTGSAMELLTEVVAFVTRNVRLDEEDRGPQDAASVLQRRVARCSGRANLAVGLLRAAGIPARGVSGLLMVDDGPRWHRWGEANLGALGWVGFDPGSSVGLVSVRHLPLLGAGDGASLEGIRLLHIDEQVFAALPIRAGLRAVPVGGVTLHCNAPASSGEFTAVLLGPDGSRWLRQGRGEVHFAGLLPGHYRLFWRGFQRSGLLRMELGGSDEVLLQLGVGKEVGS
jgi:hypothetical protein